MRPPASFRFWRGLPAYALNGIAAALGIGLVQGLAMLLAGPSVAPLVVSGAIAASIADLPNTPSRTLHRVGAAVLLSSVSALVVDLLRMHPLALGGAVGLIAFAAMMTLAWGARAGAVSFTPILSMIFAMAVPPSGHPLGAAGLSACGGIAYLGWALVSNALLQRRYRRLVLVATLRTAAALFRMRAAVLAAAGSEAGDSMPLRDWIGGEAGLADRLQAARDLILTAPDSPRWRRDVAILLRILDLRDILLASRLDADLIGHDPAGRTILERVAAAMVEIAARLDRAADHLRDATVPDAVEAAPLDADAVLAELPLAAGDPRVRLVPSLAGRLRRLNAQVERIHGLLRGAEEPLPLTRGQLARFVTPEGWPLSALAPHWRRDSLVLRHAIRMALALATAYYLGIALPWGSHANWLVLSVGVVLRGSLGETLARRNARVLGTVLGCLIVVAVATVPSQALLAAVFLVALATAHAFVTQRYWLTATAASVMALLQSHAIDPAGGFAVGERIADTFLGAFLAWCFSYVLPSWEQRSLPEGIRRVLRDLRAYAASALGPDADAKVDDAAERLARRKAYDSLSTLAQALQRSRAEPRGVRLPARQVAELLDHGERLMAHLSMVRMTLARLREEAPLPPSVDAALAGTVASLSARLDPDAVPVVTETIDPADELALLPELPAEHDPLPWLNRRLLLLRREALRIAAAARGWADASADADDGRNGASSRLRA
jgi:uncharacterized membrane protein YccC